ncbi:MAG: hypothetical protein R3F35_23535 [Myxococcota bacterium]
MRLHRIDEARDLGRLGDLGPSPHRSTLQVPIDRAPTGLSASALRLRAALERAERRLCERGLAPERARRCIEGLERALPALDTLEHDVHALVILADESAGAWARTTASLPGRVAVASHWAVRPLLRALHRERRFRLVSISRKRVETYAGDAHGLTPLEIPGLPKTMEEALGREIEGDMLSFHSARPIPGPRRTSSMPVFHGQGGADAGRSLDLERWLRIVAHALRDAWGQDPIPILIAAEVRTASELRRRLDLPQLIESGIGGPADDGSPVELHERVWPSVRAAWEAERSAQARSFERARALGKSAQDLDDVVPLAIAGRVRRLWVEEQASAPGWIDEEVGFRVAIRDGEEDALDGLVELVLRRGGEVFVMDAGATPAGTACCAELR